jgi:hypothetical protein
MSDPFEYLVRCVTTQYDHWQHLGIKPERAALWSDECGEKVAAGTKMTWDNPDVRAARLVRQPVIVTKPDGAKEEFNSLKTSFIALHLPLNKHIRFRGRLKEEGALDFEWGGKVYAFRIGSNVHI